MKFTILFPVLNEERRLQKGIEKAADYVNKITDVDFELIIVDNGSTDKTKEIALDLCEKYEKVNYIHTNDKGVGLAFREGFKSATGDIVGYMDVDLSTDIRHLKHVIKIFRENSNVDVVNASRNNRKSKVVGRKWYRNITSYGLVGVMKVFLGLKASDVICGFKFFKREALAMLIPMTKDDNGWFYIIELVVRAEKSGLNVHELPVLWTDDYDTKVKVKSLTKYYLKNIFALRSRLKAER